MTDKGIEFYGELERTWKELADAVHALTQDIDNGNGTPHLNQINEAQ
jgi:PadR family transcriptional regulator PadR